MRENEYEPIGDLILYLNVGSYYDDYRDGCLRYDLFFEDGDEKTYKVWFEWYGPRREDGNGTAIAQEWDVTIREKK